jgi:mxaA protein
LVTRSIPIAFWGLSLAAAEAASPAVTVTTDPVRAFGYVVGDEITLTTRIRLPEGCQLQPSSLPKPGAVDYWLDLKRVAVTDGESARPVIDRIYQSFYAPLAVKAQTIPAVSLAMQCEGRGDSFELPAWTFTATPLRGMSLEGGHTLRPDRWPKPPSMTPHAFGLAAALLAALGAGLRGGWRSGLWPRAGAFARARAELRRLGPEPWGGITQKKAFEVVHRAFDRHAGHPLFADRLEEFLNEQPRWQGSADEIRAFFHASYALYFDEDARVSESFGPERLKNLVAACARLEASR